jgi:DNA-binding transcriptional ArsR family regulator
MEAEEQAGTETRGLAFVHEVRTVQELRALSDPLRIVIMRLLKEQERSVKDLCDILGETSTRLYYHVRELERAGLVFRTRTETKAGSILKYYRAVAMYVTVPFDLLHDQPDSPEARAAVDLNARLLELGALDVRQALSSGIDDITGDDFYVARHYVRTTPERAREFVDKLSELHVAFLESDDEDGPVRYTMTTGFVPTRHLKPSRKPGHKSRGLVELPPGTNTSATGHASVDQSERRATGPSS